MKLKEQLENIPSVQQILINYLLGWLSAATPGHLDERLLHDFHNTLLEISASLHTYVLLQGAPIGGTLYAISIFVNLADAPSTFAILATILSTTIAADFTYYRSRFRWQVLSSIFIPLPALSLGYNLLTTSSEFASIGAGLVVFCWSFVGLIHSYYIIRILLSIYNSLENLRYTEESTGEQIRYVYEGDNFREIHGVNRENAVSYLKVVFALIGFVFWSLLWAGLTYFNRLAAVEDLLRSALDAVPSIGILTVFGGVIGKSVGGLVTHVGPQTALLFLIVFPAIIALFIATGNLRRLVERAIFKRRKGEPVGAWEELIGMYFISKILLWHLLAGEVNEELEFLINRAMATIFVTIVAAPASAILFIVILSEL